MDMKKLMAILLAGIMVFGLSACGLEKESSGSEGSGKHSVKIGYLPITHAVPLYIEDELGGKNFKHIELELVKFGSWPELMDALNTGRIDGASVLVTLAMKAKEQGIDLKAVALGHRDGNVIVASPDIHRAEDLKGKNFAIPHKFSAHNILLYQMLKKAGMEYSDVNVIELPPAEMPAALSEGRVAGYVVAEPFGALSVAMDKGKVLFQDQEIWMDSVDCVLVLRNEFIQKKNEAAHEFVHEYAKAGEIAESKDQQTHEISSKYMKIDKKVADLSFQWILYEDLRLNETSYEELRKYMLEMGLSQNPPTYQEFVDSALYDKAK